MRISAKWWLLVFAVVMFTSSLASAVPYDWAVAYQHINQHGGGDNNKFSIRSLAASQDGSDTLYYGQIKFAYDGILPSGTTNIVNIDLSGNVVHYISVSAQPKALATDDRGYVYAGAAGKVNVYPSDLSALSTFVSVTGATAIEGVTVTKSGSDYFLYASNRGTGAIARYNVTDVFNPVLDTAWGTNGVYTLPTTNVRGVMAIDAVGNVYVADKSNDRVYKIDAGGTGYTYATVDNPKDIAICGDYLYVSTEKGDFSTVEQLLVSDMSLNQSLYDSMVNTGYGSSHYGFGGIDILDGKLYVTDEDSLRVDGPTGYGDPATYYIDRIFSIDIPSCNMVPEPGTLTLIGSGLLTLAGLVLRRRLRA